MDISLDRDGSVIGSLFQQIIGDMKTTSPLWEDFVCKATKLHMCLRAAIQAIAAYLDAFQKIADAATNSKGASKEIGTALTRVCLRHKAVETRMKTFTSAIMDCLIIPLQEKLEDWRRQVAILDKEHAKEYKRCRTELKKRSSDTLRLQKKARKGQSETIQNLVDSSMQDVTLRRAELEEVEKKSLRAAMVEERTRYCCFVNMLQPVVKEECEVMSELGHLQEAMQSIALVTKDPNVLPQSSEELILESKTTLSLYPESPGGSNSQGCSNSLGSRKSSVCSISSMNSSGSSGSPGHQYQRSLSQLPSMRLKPGESSDSGFCSSPALTSQASTATNQTHAVSTWPPHTQDVVSSSDRPHTISSAYEKGHQRPALTVYTFQSPDVTDSQKSPANILCRPPLPIRCSSLERPLSGGPHTGARNNSSSIPRQCPSPIPAHITKEHPQLQPTYVNMSELASMASLKITNNQLLLQQQLQQQLNSPVSIASSLISSDSSATNQQSSPDLSAELQTPQNNSPQTNTSPTQTTPVSGSCFDDNNFTTLQQQTESNDKQLLFSPDNDIKCKGSVLEKTSMFEKLELLTTTNNNITQQIPRSESIYGKRNEEIYKSAGMLERDTDQYQDSIEELNNLIGELDSFQREHEIFSRTNGNGNHHNRIDNNETDSDLNDKLSLQGYNYSTTSSDSRQNDGSDIESNRFSTDELDMGFENPSFLHLNNDIIDIRSSSSYDNNEHFNRQNSTSTTTSSSTNSSEIVLLRCKENQTNQINDTENLINNQNKKNDTLQRFSSFRASEQYQRKTNNILSNNTMSDDNNKYIVSKLNLKNCENNIMKITPTTTTPTTPPPTTLFNHINNHINNISNDHYQMMNNHHNHHHDERIRLKPVVSPRPASLSGSVTTRITRRSSVNSMKPPPPVRRSSSVTPSHNVSAQKSPSLSQQNLMNASSESLPPPPAYLLDTAGNHNTSPGKNVAETVKALTEIRHMPASPSVLRRAQNQINQVSPMQQNNAQYINTFSSTPKHDNSSVTSMYNTPQPHSTSLHNSSNDNSSHNNSSYKTPNTSSSSQSGGIYAQPKQVSKMSSFRTQSPGTPKQSSGLIAQLNSRLAPAKQQQQQQQQQQQPIYSQQQNQYNSSDTRNQSMYHDSRNNQQTYDTTTRQSSGGQYGGGQHSNTNIGQQPIGQSIDQIYSRTTTTNDPRQQQQQQQHYERNSTNYHQQTTNVYMPQQQQQQNNDGKNQIYVSQQHQQQHQQKPKQQQYNQNIYVSTNPFITTPTTRSNYSPSSFGKDTGNYSTNTNYTTNYDKSGSLLTKTSVGFLENLNAKLAEQRLSGKAFAVRNLINSKALQNFDCFKNFPVKEQPDPRICHESLMDQIKRGATLKRNRTVNDRSAPKIH